MFDPNIMLDLWGKRIDTVSPIYDTVYFTGKNGRPCDCKYVAGYNIHLRDDQGKKSTLTIDERYRPKINTTDGNYDFADITYAPGVVLTDEEEEAYLRYVVNQR